MGMLIEGQWEVNPDLADNKSGHFVRPHTQFRNWVRKNADDFEPKCDRYHIYVSYACPWAHRTLIIRQLKQLQDCITVSVVDPIMGDQGWSFGKSSGDTIDALYHSAHLSELYVRTEADYTGRVTVPVLWDKKNEVIVSNESSEILLMLNESFNSFAGDKTDYYPEELREEIEEINEYVYHTINNGVYRCGFASTQAAYEESFDALFSSLDKLEERLAKKTFSLWQSDNNSRHSFVCHPHPF